MDDVYYLVHVSDTIPSLLSSGFQKRLISPSCLSDDSQFPGVYFSLITKDNINKEELYEGRYIFIFSKELLKQSNYHINILDVNGSISEGITYFPWNLKEVSKEIKKRVLSSQRLMNEVVFHDSVSMKYCYGIFDTKKGTPTLPNHEIKTAEPPNYDLLPFYSYVVEDKLTGINQPKSSLNWFIMLSKVARIENPSKNKQELIEQIRKKSKYLCTHRNEQDIEVLKKYTTPKK